MGEFNIIQRPDLILRLQSMLGLRQAHVVPSLSETVQPVVIFGDVRDTGGQRQVIRPAWGFDRALPVAANFSSVSLWNPLLRRTIITVREIRISNPTAVAAQQFSMAVFGPGLATQFAVVAAFPPKFRHSRAIDPLSTGQVNLPTGVLSDGASPGGVGTTAYVLKTPDTREVTTYQPVVLLPGWELRVQNDAVNQGVSVAMSWEEEDLEQLG